MTSRPFLHSVIAWACWSTGRSQSIRWSGFCAPISHGFTRSSTDRGRWGRWKRGGKAMETDKRYFIEGLFIIGFSIGAALFAVWLVTTGHRDDVIYRIHFEESVSGLALGDPVKFHGVDVGNVKAFELDPADPHLVQVDVQLRKETPVKTDTKASLKLKGITGVVFVELNGASPG